MLKKNYNYTINSEEGVYDYDGSIDWNMYFGNYNGDICLGMFRISDL